MAGRPTRDTPTPGRSAHGSAAARGHPLARRPAAVPDPRRRSERRGGAAERSRTFLTLAEAKRELAKLVAGRNPNGSMTLEQWHEKYWPAIASSIRPATARSYGVAWRLRVKPSLGRHRLEDITSPMIESAMVAWSGGASAKNDALAVLSRLLDGARRSRFIDYNPAREVKRPSMRESISPVSRALTLDQIQTLLDLVPEGAYRGYLAALVYTGMRAGEATALRVGDVDFERGIIRVSRSLSPGQRGELIEQSPKSHKSRDVPLIDALRPYAEAAARGKRRATCSSPVPTAAGSRTTTRAAAPTGRRCARRSADPTCASTTSGTRSRRSCSMPAPARPTCRRPSGTRACRSPSATRGPARASRFVPAQH